MKKVSFVVVLSGVEYVNELGKACPLYCRVMLSVVCTVEQVLQQWIVPVLPVGEVLRVTDTQITIYASSDTWLNLQLHMYYRSIPL